MATRVSGSWEVSASSQKTADQTFGSYLKPGGAARLLVHLDLTSLGGSSPELTEVAVEGKDPVSGTWFNVASIGPFTSTGFRTLLVGPGTSSGGEITGNTQVPLPNEFRIIVDVSTANGNETYTYSLGAEVLR